MFELRENDMITMVKDACASHGYVLGLFIYGFSFEENEFKNSDLEFLIIISDNKKHDEIKNVITEFCENYSRIIRIHVLSYEETNKNNNPLVQLIFREGKLIYWNSINDMVASQIFKVKPHSVISFDLNKLQQNEKAKFNYQLYGKKNNGLLEKLGGKRLNKGCFYVQYSNKFKILRFLAKFDIKYHCFECWI
jgi:hypothetical protein